MRNVLQYVYIRYQGTVVQKHKNNKISFKKKRTMRSYDPLELFVWKQFLIIFIFSPQIVMFLFILDHFFFFIKIK